MSDDRRPAAAAPHELTVDDLWQLQTYPFTLMNGHDGRPMILRLRRLDPLTQMMEDVIKAPLLDAAMKVIAEVQQWINEGKDGDGRNFVSAFQHMAPEKKQTVLEHLCHYASRVVLTPTLFAGPIADCPAGEFPAVLLGADALFAIWNHTPPVPGIPRLSEVAAEEFRPSSGADTPGAAPDGQDVPTAAVGVVGTTVGPHE